jgi:hypothetical protein
METGVGQQALNRAEAKKMESIAKMTSSYAGAANSIRDTTTNLISQFQNLGKAVMLAAAPSIVPMEGDRRGIAADPEYREFQLSQDAENLDLTMRAKRGDSGISAQDILRKDMGFATQSRLQGQGLGLPIPSQQQVMGAQLPFQTAAGLQLDPTVSAMMAAQNQGIQLTPPLSPQPSSAAPGITVPVVPPPQAATSGSSITGQPASPGAAPSTAGQQSLNFEAAAPLEIPLIFKVEGDSVRVAFASMESRIIAKINNQTVA